MKMQLLLHVLEAHFSLVVVPVLYDLKQSDFLKSNLIDFLAKNKCHNIM